MHLIDRSPGGFIFVANAVLYTTVLAETWMLTTGSVVAMTAVMTMIIVIAAYLARFIMNLMGSEAYIAGEAEPATATVTGVSSAPAPAPAHPSRVAARRPSRRPAAPHGPARAGA
jgi:hypothetical protein